MNHAIRQSLFLLVCIVIAHATAAKQAWGDEDVFIDKALDPEFSRGVRGVIAGGSRIESTATNNGQHTGMSFTHIFVGSDLWNNEHNEVLGGVQYTNRSFDREIQLPSGITVPDRIDTASAALIYKHITSNDWSLSQSVRYTHINSDGLSGTDTNAFDLVGLAAVSREPGRVWLYGYIWNHTGYLFNTPTPLIEYADATNDEFSYVIGFPILDATYRPHPDWTLNLNWTIGDVLFTASAVYKVTDRDTLRLSYGGDSWAYHLAGPIHTNVKYTAIRLAFDWEHPYYIFRKGVMVNVSIGREMNRKIGLLSFDDATIVGLNVKFGF